MYEEPRLIASQQRLRTIRCVRQIDLNVNTAERKTAIYLTGVCDDSLEMFLKKLPDTPLDCAGIRSSPLRKDKQRCKRFLIYRKGERVLLLIMIKLLFHLL